MVRLAITDAGLTLLDMFLSPNLPMVIYGLIAKMMLFAKLIG